MNNMGLLTDNSGLAKTTEPIIGSTVYKDFLKKSLRECKSSLFILINI